MEIKRLLSNLCSQDLSASKAFYCALFDFKVSYDSDWFVNLHSEATGLELGLISPTSEFVPAPARGQIKGMYLTFVVEDVNQLFAQASAQNYEILQAPAPTAYSQNRMLVKAPEGTICDVSSPIKN